MKTKIGICKGFLQLTVVFLIFVGVAFGQYNKTESKGWSEVNVEAVYNLISRILPDETEHFKVEVIPDDNGKDVFELESKNGNIILRGNNGISIASGFNYYLKYYAHCDISWNGSNLNIHHPLPVIPKPVRKTSPYKYRYYFNYCTFNYTASWWDWDRWQKEIDFMALNGINMPLALTGQNVIWQQVYKSMGFTDKDLEDFFSGPAYFSWFWMGNLDGYGGPLPQSWIKSHEALQKKILERERELGMTPVLPAFTGHVPPSFKEKFPETKLMKTHWVDGFNDVYFIDPTDTMFTYVGKKFMTEQTKVYGTDHLYSADTFNENMPPSDDSTFLSEISKKVYLSMTDIDSEAVWVMQGWLFYYQANFWKPRQIKALLNAIPDSKMIILDLWSEVNPVWRRTEAYYGKPWIWCMLHNFGGRTDMFGNMKEIAEGPSNALNNLKSKNMIGIGITAEGIEQNPAVYELMLDNVWRSKPVNLDTWLKEYTTRRYGRKIVQTEKAWEILLHTVYDTSSSEGRESTIIERPTFDMKTNVTYNTEPLPYKVKDLLPAWGDLISASGELKNSDGFQYDLVNVTRQVLSNYSDYLYQKFSTAYKEKNLAEVKKYSSQFLNLIDDMDELLSTREDFLLGRWINEAKKWATNEKEKKLYEKNARDLVTLWAGGSKNISLHDYAWKQWAGLLKDFYKPRWEKFFQYVIHTIQKREKFDQDKITNEIKNWEWKWVNSTNSFSSLPSGDPVSVSQKMYKKYFPTIKGSL